MITFFCVTGKPEKTAGISARNAKTNSEIPYERSPPRGRHLWKFVETKESVYMRKEFNFHRIGLEHTNMVAFSLFWNTNMTAVTSRENALLITRHYPDLGSASDWMQILVHPIRSSTHNWVVTCHQYGISAVVPQMSFCGESSSGDVKCRQFFQASYCVGLYLANHTGNGFVKKHTEKLFSVYTDSIVAPGEVGKGN